MDAFTKALLTLGGVSDTVSVSDEGAGPKIETKSSSGGDFWITCGFYEKNPEDTAIPGTTV